MAEGWIPAGVEPSFRLERPIILLEGQSCMTFQAKLSQDTRLYGLPRWC